MSYNWSLQKPFIQGPRPASCNFLDLLPTTFPLLHLLLLQTTFPLLLSPGDNCRGYPPCRVPAIMLVLHNLFADKHFLLVSFVMLFFQFSIWVYSVAYSCDIFFCITLIRQTRPGCCWRWQARPSILEKAMQGKLVCSIGGGALGQVLQRQLSH